MSSKYNTLVQSFENLKDLKNHNESFYTLIQKIIAPMSVIDLIKALEMWEYLLVKYYRRCEPYEYSTLTGEAIEELSSRLGTAELLSIFMQNKTIRDKVFRYNFSSSLLFVYWFVRDIILGEELKDAEILLSLLEKNKAANLYEALRSVSNSSDSRWKITNEGIDFVRKWACKINDNIERTQIEVDLLDLEDCVSGAVARGSMPLRVFSELDKSESAIDAILNDIEKRESEAPVAGVIQFKSIKNRKDE